MLHPKLTLLTKPYLAVQEDGDPNKALLLCANARALVQDRLTPPGRMVEVEALELMAREIKVLHRSGAELLALAQVSFPLQRGRGVELERERARERERERKRERVRV